MTNNVMNMDGSFKPFRAWCQHVLPLVYDDSLSYMELLNKVIVYINNFGEYLEEFTAINEVKYGGPWDVTKQYTPNTVVSLGDTGYMSIKPVPAGIDIHNTEYWLQVADFAGQVVDLGVRVIALENSMETAESDIDNLETSMDSTIGRVSALESSVATANGKIATLENETSDIYGLRNNSTRKIICISDSYGLTPSVADSWISKMQSYMGISDANMYRSQENGSGFIGYHSPDITFKTQLETLATNMSVDEKNNIDDIVIAGGWNDAQQYMNGAFTASELGTAIQTCINYARNTFSNANIWIAFLGWGCKNPNEHKYVRFVINCYQQYSYMTNTRVACITGINWLHRQALTASDGIHPNSAGADAIGKSITSALMGGTPFCDMAPGSYDGKIAIGYETDTTKVSSLSFQNAYQIYDDGIGSMYWDKITFTNVASFNHLDEIKLCNFTDSIIQGGNGATNGAKFPCVMRYNYTMYNAFVLIHDNALFIGNMSMTDIPANSTIEIFYGGGPVDIFL